jgi:hypothetical protein
MKPWEKLFDDRYGEGAFRRLAGMLDQPCLTFATIAAEFSVTRERVRQWHRDLHPDAPGGHERTRRCVMRQRRRAVVLDPLFRAFYRHARAHYRPEQFSLVPTRAAFVRRVVVLDGHRIVIREARANTHDSAFLIYGCARPASFVYYQLTTEEFLLLPRSAVPARAAVYRPGETPALDRYHNTFAAVLSRDRASRQGAAQIGQSDESDREIGPASAARGA